MILVMNTRKSVRDLETFQEIDQFNAVNFEKSLKSVYNQNQSSNPYKTVKPRLNQPKKQRLSR